MGSSGQNEHKLGKLTCQVMWPESSKEEALSPYESLLITLSS